MGHDLHHAEVTAGTGVRRDIVGPPAEGRPTHWNGSAMVGRLLLEVAQRVRRSRSLALLRTIEGAPLVPKSEVLADQFRRLSALLAHAETRVPYYREMFRSLGIQSRDIRSLDDFAKLPTLTKDIIRERERDLLCEGVSPARLRQGASGGSTGIPLRFYFDDRYLDASDAGTFRNLRQAGWQPGEVIAFFWGHNEQIRHMPRWQFELRQMARRVYQFNPFHSGPAQMDEWLKRWRRLGVRVALGYASTIARFAEHIEATGQWIVPLRGVFTTGEKLYPLQRECISRVFGCRVYDCYGSSEVRNIAAECPQGGMHVNADFVVLEVDTTSAPPWGPAPFIVTSLWNYAMPFIRYRNEDCGGLLDEACDCPNHFPLMHLDIARVNDNFVLPGDTVVHGLFFTYLMYGSEGIANFQFHQIAPDRITLWVVPGYGSASARERVIHSAVQRIQALTPVPIHVDVYEVESIPLSAAGKHRYTRSDVIAATRSPRPGEAAP